MGGGDPRDRDDVDMTRVHQFTPVFAAHDAIGNHIESVRAALRDAGIGGEVFAEHVEPTMKGRGHLFSDYGTAVPAEPDDVLLYHLAIGSRVGDFVAARPERMAVWYHNITPPEFLRPWEVRAAPGVAWGVRQMEALATRADFSIADSSFNARELEDAGYADPVVVPILLEPAHFQDTPDPEVVARIRSEQVAGGADMLFVGRLAPNKCQHDLVKVLAAVRAGLDPAARLRLVGGAGMASYAAALRDLIHELGLDEAVEIAGTVSAGALAAYYSTADVFVSVSEHEGFCVPLLEAMAHDVPVIGYGAGAIPETIGGGGVVLPEKRPGIVAAAVGRIIRDEALRTALVEGGRAQLRSFAPDVVAARLLEVFRAHGVEGT